MPEALAYLVMALFLPLFPFSILFNALYVWTNNVLFRGLLLLLWPQLGLALASTVDIAIAPWVIVWALASAGLYAFRAIAVRDVGQWTSFLASSFWALLWVIIAKTPFGTIIHIHALGMSLPLVLLCLLGAELEQRFGAAYTGLYGGLATTLPRLSALLVTVVLAIVATPLFPTFFSMVAMLLDTLAVIPSVAVGLLIIWLLWSWAGARLLQGLIVGPEESQPVTDLSLLNTWTYSLVLIALVLFGIYMLGSVL